MIKLDIIGMQYKGFIWLKVKDFAIMVTDKVQKFGKAKVISSRNIPLLLERQKILSATGLATCKKP